MYVIFLNSKPSPFLKYIGVPQTMGVSQLAYLRIAGGIGSIYSFFCWTIRNCLHQKWIHTKQLALTQGFHQKYSRKKKKKKKKNSILKSMLKQAPDTDHKMKLRISPFFLWEFDYLFAWIWSQTWKSFFWLRNNNKVLLLVHSMFELQRGNIWLKIKTIFNSHFPICHRHSHFPICHRLTTYSTRINI